MNNVKKIFSEQEMWQVINFNSFESTLCKNEPTVGTDTIQVSSFGTDEAFGEFVGNDKGGYVFEMYKV